MSLRVLRVVMMPGLLFLMGCGSGDIPLTDVSGKATFAGQPIVFGQIEFVPDSAQKHTGPAGSATISNGAFNTAEGGSGISPGPHLVRITGYDTVPPATSEDETATTQGTPPLFVGYTIEMDVPGGEVTIDVAESAKGFNLYSGQQPKRSGNEP